MKSEVLEENIEATDHEGFGNSKIKPEN